jgi:hypothetical protein
MADDSWAQEARSDGRWRREQEAQQTIDIIEALIDARIDTPAAVEQVTLMYEPLAKEEPDSVPGIWNVICIAARSIGDNVEVSKTLVDFILGIQQAGDVLDDSGQPVKLNGQTIWSDLAEFSYNFRLHGICNCLRIMQTHVGKELILYRH